jgi:hypothetical protein
MQSPLVQAGLVQQVIIVVQTVSVLRFLGQYQLVVAAVEHEIVLLLEQGKTEALEVDLDLELQILLLLEGLAP